MTCSLFNTEKLETEMCFNVSLVVRRRLTFENIRHQTLDALQFHFSNTIQVAIVPPSASSHKTTEKRAKHEQSF